MTHWLQAAVRALDAQVREAGRVLAMQSVPDVVRGRSAALMPWPVPRGSARLRVRPSPAQVSSADKVLDLAAGLPAGDREVVMARLCGLSYRAIAEAETAAGRPPRSHEAVRRHYHRCLAELALEDRVGRAYPNG